MDAEPAILASLCKPGCSIFQKKARIGCPRVHCLQGRFMLLCVDLMVKASWTFRLVTYCSVFLTVSYPHWSEWSVSIVCGDASLYLHFDSHHHRRMKARIISCLIDPDLGHTYLGEGLVLTLPHFMSPHPSSIYFAGYKIVQRRQLVGAYSNYYSYEKHANNRHRYSSNGVIDWLIN